jgi:hexosaminidase
VRSRVVASLIVLALHLGDTRAADATIVPRPASLQPCDGEFVLRADSVLVADRTVAAEAERLAAALAPAIGTTPRVIVARHLAALRRRLRLCARNPRKPERCRSWIRFERIRRRPPPTEGYRLDVSPGIVRIRAGDTAGLFYGAESFRQLLPPTIFASAPAATAWAAPCVRIEDQPRFRWRGAMLDVGRRFMPKPFVLKLIDLLALHKLNRFHWHLTDDQGWRLEIRRYPKLTEVGSMRTGSPVRPLSHGNFLNFIVNGFFGGLPIEVDDVPHAGFYTQDDVREVVAYAAARHVEIVPEIDMPGHVTAAIAAHPELGNTGLPIPVATTVGIHEDIFNVKEETFAFLEDVLDEVLALFPGEFVHVGGDEVPVVQWEESADAQARMAALGLTDERQLATYFTNRIGTFVAGRGRRWIGWNDILRDGLAADAAIMSWTGTGPGTLAAQAGRDVVMAPLGETYFDHANALPLPPAEQAVLDAAPGAGLAPLFVTTVEEAYGFEPVPSELTPEQAAHVLGGQAQLWTEWMLDGRDVERAGFPRLAAFAETVWSPAALRDYPDFAVRLATHAERLTALDVCWFGSPVAACP